MWPDIFKSAKAAGLNMVEVYVFWNFHEVTEGIYDWSGRANLSAFIQSAADNDLFVNLRIGPYVCAEWDYGGIPVWLGQKPGIQFRTVNTIWQTYMQNWFNMVINQVSKYFPNTGGPIVLVQVENELGGAPGQYVTWAGDIANQAVAPFGGVPIIMCNGQSASNTINTCNGNDCTGFIEGHGQSGRILVDQPALWTENEEGFQLWGNSPYHTTNYFWGRSAQDIAGAIGRWFARGGSHMNYYMFFGGNHYGAYAGSSITAFYSSDANLCPDTLPHEPKYSHLNRLHELLALNAEVIVSTKAQLDDSIPLLYFDNSTNRFESGTQQFAFVYGKGTSGEISFIENDASIYILTQYKGKNYTMPEYSITLVDFAGNELYSTGKVQPPTTHRVDVDLQSTPFQWQVWPEPLLCNETSTLPAIFGSSPYEQNNVTKPALWTQYMYYQQNVTAQGSLSLQIGGQKASSYVVYVDGVYAGSTTDLSHWFGEGHINPTINNVNFGKTTGHELLILSESYGNDNQMGVGSGEKVKGITGKVILGGTDITNQAWKMQVGLAGEILQVYTAAGSKKVQWQDWRNGKLIPAWFQTQFTIPNNLQNGEVLLLNITGGVGRGHFYINGRDLGRYWSIQMNDGSGRETQSLYHIPLDWCNVGGQNILTLGEVLGASDLTGIMVIRRKMVAGPPEKKMNREKVMYWKDGERWDEERLMEGVAEMVIPDEQLHGYYTIDTCPM